MNPSELPDETLFEGALQCSSPAERVAYLDRVCASQPELRQRFEALLAAHEQAGDFLAPPTGSTNKLELAPEESSGTVIGRYKLLQEIGEGGMGVVYMAEQEDPVVRKVALKIIKLGMDTKQVVARFEAERQALALMDHPNIAKVLDAGATDMGRPYFVMELVHGVPITEYCDKNRLSTRERLELFIPVCQAVQHAHQKGIIHRDLKPSNVMVTLHDGVPVPKVIDFGVAKATNQRLTEKTLFTNYGQMIGTPAYMSPEQAEMSGLDIDTRSDVYSLGVLLYELLTGSTPFDARELLSKGFAEMQRIIAQQEPPKPSTRMSTMQHEERTVVLKNRGVEGLALTRTLRGDLDWIVMKCLEKNRTRRYEAASALALDVQRHLNTEPVQACPPSRWYEFQKTVRRHKVGFAATATVILVLMAGIVVSTLQAVRARNAEAREVVMRAQAESEAYASDMSFASRLVGQGRSLGGVDALLSRWNDREPDPRGWEWYYLYGLCHQERLTIKSGDLHLRSVAWHPKGGQLASGGSDGTLRIWSPMTGRLMFELSSIGTAINQVAWSPDGKSLASAGDNGSVRIWDPARGIETATFEGHTNKVYCVAWSPDSKSLYTAGEDFTIHRWNVTTGESIEHWITPEVVKSLSIHPDGSRFATCGDDGWLRVWTVGHDPVAATVAEPQTVKLDAHFAHQLAWSSNAEQIAVAGLALEVFDTRTFASVPGWPDLWEPAAVAWSPDGKYLATANLGDGKISILDRLTGRLIRPFEGHLGRVYSLTWSPDSTELASAGGDGTLKLWRMVERQRGEDLVAKPGQTYSTDWHPDGVHLLQGNSEGSIWIWNTITMVNPFHFQASTSWIFRVTWNPAGTRFAVGSKDGHVRIYTWPEYEESLTIQAHPREIRGLAWNPTGSRIASLDFYTGLRIWDSQTGGLLASFPDLRGMALAWSSNGRLLAAGGVDNLVVLDTITGTEVLRSNRHHGHIRDAAWSPNQLQLASVGDDNKLILWDLTGAKAEQILVGHDTKVYSVDWTPDGTRLASVDWGGQLNFWDPASGRLVCSLSPRDVPLFSVKWNPDGRRLAASSYYGEILLFDATPGYEANRMLSGLP